MLQSQNLCILGRINSSQARPTLYFALQLAHKDVIAYCLTTKKMWSEEQLSDMVLRQGLASKTGGTSKGRPSIAIHSCLAPTTRKHTPCMASR